MRPYAPVAKAAATAPLKAGNNLPGTIREHHAGQQAHAAPHSGGHETHVHVHVLVLWRHPLYWGEALGEAVAHQLPRAPDSQAAIVVAGTALPAALLVSPVGFGGPVVQLADKLEGRLPYPPA